MRKSIILQWLGVLMVVGMYPIAYIIAGLPRDYFATDPLDSAMYGAVIIGLPLVLGMIIMGWGDRVRERERALRKDSQSTDSSQ